MACNVKQEPADVGDGVELPAAYEDYAFYIPIVKSEYDRENSSHDSDQMSTSFNLNKRKCSYKSTRESSDARENVIENNVVLTRQIVKVAATKESGRNLCDKNHFECDICTKKFNNKSNLNRHKRIHTGEKPFQCNICTKEFNDRSHLNRHKEVHCSERPPESNICMKKSNSVSGLSSLNVTVKQETADGESESDVGLDFFRISNNIYDAGSETVKTEGNTNPGTPCNINDNQRMLTNIISPRKDVLFSDKLTLDERTFDDNIKVNHEPVKCEIESPDSNREDVNAIKCKARIKTESAKVERECNDSRESFDCGERSPLSKCSNRSTKDLRERRDVAKNLSEDDISIKNVGETSVLKTRKRRLGHKNTFECNICVSKFNNKSNLNRHRRIHTGDKPFQCNICTREFNDRSHLNRHKRIHSSEKTYKCNICAKKFNNRSDLTSHRRIHSEKKCFGGRDCTNVKRGEEIDGHTVSSDAATSTNCNKQSTPCGKHKRRLNKSFRCDVCTRTFSLMSNLKVHKRVHTGEKPFACTICSKKFAEVGNLNRHKRIHSKEKPFECNICAKKFVDRSYLIAHKFVHNNEKPFECNICKKKFRVPSSLYSHRRIHRTGK